MNEMPVSPEQYFSDFAQFVKRYKVFRNGKLLIEAEGLSNEYDDGPVVAFIMPIDIVAGDIIQLEGVSSTVLHVSVDFFASEPAMLIAHVSCEI